MVDFETILLDTRDIQDREELEDYFEDFFVPNNYNQYEIDEDANDKERKAIYDIFHDDTQISLRIEKILKEDPLCIEALIVLIRIGEDSLINNYLYDQYLRSDEYNNLSVYGKKEYIKLLNLYSVFFSSIRNLTMAIKMTKKAVELEGGYSNASLSQLTWYYSEIEDADAYYDLYLNQELYEAIHYLLLIVVLLKHGRSIQAREVFTELLSRYPYSEYIDHMWDLENDESKEAQEFKETINICFENLISVPDFFSWCQDNKEGGLIS